MKLLFSTLSVISTLLIQNPQNIEIPLAKVQAQFPAFINSSNSVSSSRIGSANTGDTYDMYGWVADEATGVTYFRIKYGNTFAYINDFSCEFVDMYNGDFIPSETIETVSFVSLDGNIRKQSYTDLIDTYLLLPSYVREMFQIDGFTIRMTEKYIEEEAYRGYPSWKGNKLNGVFDYERKMLYLNDENARYILHEMGHYVNNKLGGFSNRQENNELFLTESNKISLYAKEKSSEYFSECFDMYFRSPKILKDVSIQSYNMVERALYEFECLVRPELDEYFSKNI